MSKPIFILQQIVSWLTFIVGLNLWFLVFACLPGDTPHFIGMALTVIGGLAAIYPYTAADDY